MKAEILKFFNLQRQIFGICPECGEFFRLSDCKIFLKKKPLHDWMDGITEKIEKLDKYEEKLEEEKEKLQEKAREKGRKQAQRIVKTIDPIFTPRKLNPDDAKVIFHPVDYIVFNGMKENSLKNLVLLDRETKASEHRELQRSIEKVIEKGNYEWQTLRVLEDGTIKEE